MSDPATQTEIEKHRDYLYRYALLQLRDASRADDVVQETLLAAMESGSKFAGRSSPKTWLTGILKHKIIDLFRRQSRETQVPVATEGEDEREFADQFFDQARTDHWHTFPPTWQDPERSFEQKRFWEIFERCNTRPPEQTARFFAMREFMGMDTGDICKELGISSTNRWVILYRARMNLRECLKTTWFGPEEKVIPVQ
jgi:RNA polymerase sigma-70 factor (ECF subfamily)